MRAKGDETMSKPVEHGPEQCFYDNLTSYGQQPVILCMCGQRFCAATWESVGADFDKHLELSEEEE